MRVESRGDGGAAAPRLLERDDDLHTIDVIAAAAAGGAGSMLLIEGPAGIGKTALLDHLRGRAAAAGMVVYTARGGDLERGFGFGIVRQLLESTVLGADVAERERLLGGAARLAEPVFTDVEPAASTADIAFATLHGLYWLLANLAERAPLVLLVDDAHCADDPSLRFLLHLAPRLAGLPILVALSVRTSPHKVRAELRALTLESRAPVVRPQPLSDDAVASLVRALLGAGAGDRLCHSCAVATGGNPFLLSELLGEFRRTGRSARTIDPSDVDRLVPERVSASVLIRVSQLGPAASALARAVAVLGEWARLSTCARFTGLDVTQAADLAAALVDSEILVHGEPLRCVHPLIRTAIYEDLSHAERANLHARAVRVLAEQHCERGVIGAHLLATAPAGDLRAVAMLREAARAALAGGAPETAVALLRRALDEPPDDAERPDIVSELGIAEYETGDASATVHLREAIDTAADPLTRARAVMALAWSNHPDANSQRAQLPFYEQAASEIGLYDRELQLQLEGARLGALLLNPDLPDGFEQAADKFSDFPARTRAECLIRSFVARRALQAGPVAVAGDLAEQAARHPALVSEGGHPLWRTNVTICLMEAERYDAAEHMLSRAMRHAERMGSPQWLARAQWLRGLVRHRRGDLRAAEVDGRAAVDIHGAAASYTKTPGLVVVIDTLADQGRVDEADGLLVQRGMDGALIPTLFAVLPLLARGRLHAAAGRHELARDDLLDALSRIQSSRGTFPWAGDARVALVPVLLALGEDVSARKIADEAVSCARVAASPRRLGGALRVRGLCAGGRERLDLLREAVDVLQDSPALLWRAETLVDFGRALRLAGQHDEARDILRAGLDLAHRCRAAPLADQAERETRAAGGRPRRRAAVGADALTASERRVAEMAAEGMSNKDIAQALFVTLRTVELHLSNAYAKLGIRSRQDLAGALIGDGGQPR
ncbi:LuxR family transcriptional regulator [Mycolicibacterium psychrotolerans]|uniref:LuxR family transcriptional regulator n=1 Tax=Mycolicibacterium psychrotolerans TaxID=216929 RepID=A0A7I7MFA6_9MYCO|nr:LuxR family transcriptional regulator [Mycolicibacterium psychrotolerans]